METTTEDGEVVKGDFKYRTPLDNYREQITHMATRCGDYAKTLAEAVTAISKHDWGLRADDVTEEQNYSGALTTLENEFRAINDKLSWNCASGSRWPASAAKTERLPGPCT